MPFKKPPKRTEKEVAAFKHYAANPVEAVKDWFQVTPDDWQGDALTALFNGTSDRGAFKAAHGVGKTTYFAWGGWIFLECFENCRLVATAPTFAQLNDVLFPEYQKWHGRMNETMRNEWNLSGSHIRHKGNPYDWFAVARTSNKPANLQGFHGQNIMIQGDEASAIPASVFEVIEGTLSEAGEDGKVAKLAMGGNPNFTAGELYNAFGRNKELYDRVTITGDPKWFAEQNVEQGGYLRDHGRVYLSKRVTDRYRNVMAKKYGEDSAVYDVRVRGIFPRVADDVIIPFDWAQRATMQADTNNYDAVRDPVKLAVDVARGGGAESVVGFFRGNIPFKMTAKKSVSTIQTVNMVMDAIEWIKAQGLRLSVVVVDEPGVGGGVIDLLRALDVAVTPYNGGRGLVKGVDPEEDCRMFANIRARDWWNVRRLLEQNKLPLPNDEELVNQLSCLKYKYNPMQKIVVESKEDLKDRLGKDASPDRGDVIVMGCAMSYHSAQIISELRPEDLILGDERPAPDEGLGDFYQNDKYNL